MYTYILMCMDFFKTGRLHWYMIFITFILIRWLTIRLFADRYKPYTCQNKPFFTSIIIPVVDEPIDIFTRVLTTIADQNPNELIIVINGPKNEGLDKACQDLRDNRQKNGKDTTEIKILHAGPAGKRNAIRLGVESTNPFSDICILCDSDSIWTGGTLENLLMPFSADDRVGGVTTRQKIYKPNRNLVTMVAALLEEIRAEGTMKAMSVTGKVGCLPGRTIAFRTEILRDAMHEFMTETFMGIHKEVSDDRSLTNLTLKKGYKTVMQDSSVVFTDAPTTWKKFVRQQLRWAEGSQYNNIKMTGWMFRNARLMFFIYWSDILMPFLLISTYTNIGLCFLYRKLGYPMYSLPYSLPPWLMLLLILLGAAVGMGIRHFIALTKLPPYYMALMPLMTLILSFVMTPIRIVGLLKCADGLSWGTRDLEEEQSKSRIEYNGGIQSPGEHKSHHKWNRYQIGIRTFTFGLMLFFIVFSFALELLFNSIS